MKVPIMDPVLGYAIFVFLFLLFAIWAGKQIEAERKRIAAEISAEN